MNKLSSFTFLTLNGFYKGPNEDISWHKHRSDEEEADFSADSLKADNMLLFGRVTYEMMIKWWPTAAAIESMPEVANGMNKAEKIVFSKSLKKADWNNTRIIREDIINEIKKLKKEGKKNMTILGSGSILTQFAEEGLIDEYSIMIDPLAIGKGTPLFKDIKQQLNLELANTKTFKNGVILLNYRPAKSK